MKGSTFVWLSCLLVASLCSMAAADSAAEQQEQTGFVSAGKDFPRSEKNLRKWETPVVADLDQDGWVDLILNDHGYSIQVVWNNKGKYAKPWDLLMGDAHGLSVGDFDQDGSMEIVVSRGGGSGSNARNSIIYKVGKDRAIERMPEFVEPLALMRGRTVKFFDGDNDGDLDLLNLAFPSSEKKGTSENYVYENDGAGRLLLDSSLPPSRANGQKILVTDFNSDGIDDLFMYGNGDLRVFKGKGDLSFEDVSKKVLENQIQDATGIVEIDFDNDGDFDIYISRGVDMVGGDTFYDATTQTWGFYGMRGKFKFEDVAIGDVVDIENYQSPWPNKKLYTGETAQDYEFPGETHSGKDIHLVNSDTLGWPDETPNKGLYVGFVGNERWRFAGETWSPLSAVVHGVKGNPASVDTTGPEDILLENKNGRFVEVTAKAGLSLREHTTGVVAADFDNSGFEDLLVVQRGNLVSANESVLWLNQGDGSFKVSRAHGVVSPELGAIGLGVESLDYNQDGKLDVLLGNERGKWHLFRNEKLATQDYLIVDLGEAGIGIATTIGARVTVEACGLKQVKRSASGGAPYSRSFNRYLHFGLGKCSGPVSVEVVLSNGAVFKKTVESVNTTIAVEVE